MLGKMGKSLSDSVLKKSISLEDIINFIENNPKSFSAGAGVGAGLGIDELLDVYKNRNADEEAQHALIREELLRNLEQSNY